MFLLVIQSVEIVAIDVKQSLAKIFEAPEVHFVCLSDP